jgi:hypothetical protein
MRGEVENLDVGEWECGHWIAPDWETVNLGDCETVDDRKFVILSGAKDLAPTPAAFFGAGARSFAALRTTASEGVHSLSMNSSVSMLFVDSS